MTTPTAALVEEAEKMAVRALDGTASREEKSALFASLAAALRRAETERFAALKQSAAWEIQAQDMRDRLVKAEAARDAQHEQVLRLTAERDEARQALSEKHLSERQAVRYVLDRRDALIAKLLKTIEELRAQVWGLGCKVTNLRDALRRQYRENYELKCRLSDVESLRYEVYGLRSREQYRDRDQSKLTAEDARLQKERDAALAMEADTARRSSAEIDSLKAELNEARGEVEDLNRRVEEVCGQRDEARERLSEAMRRT